MELTKFYEQLKKEMSVYENLTFWKEQLCVSIGTKRPRQCFTMTILKDLINLCEKHDWCMCTRHGKLYVWPLDMEDML